MDCQDQDSAVETCRQFVGLFNDSGKQNQKNYQNYAKLYDKMMDTGYRTPEILSKMCMKHLKTNSADTVLLDVASGTGRIGHRLKSFGYEGVIDGIEASSEMIKESKNEFYRDLKEHFLSEDQPMPYPDNTYDAVVCAGALCLGHIQHQCLDDMIRVLKPGGILLFNVAKLEYDKDDIAIPAVQELMNKMVSDNRCKLIEKVSEQSYQNLQFQMADKALFYCYQKI